MTHELDRNPQVVDTAGNLPAISEQAPQSRSQQLQSFATACDWMVREIAPYAEIDSDHFGSMSEDVLEAIRDRQESAPKAVQKAVEFLRSNPALMPEQRRGHMSVGLDEKSGWAVIESDITENGPVIIMLGRVQQAVLKVSQNQQYAGTRFDAKTMLADKALEGLTRHELERAVRGLNAKFEEAGQGSVLIRRKTEEKNLFSFPNITITPGVTIDEPLTTPLPIRRNYPFSHRARKDGTASTFRIQDRASFEILRILVAEASYTNDSYVFGEFTMRELQGVLPESTMDSPADAIAWLDTMPEARKFISLRGEISEIRGIYRSDSIDNRENWATTSSDKSIRIEGIFDLLAQDQVAFVRPYNGDGLQPALPEGPALGTLAILGSNKPVIAGQEVAVQTTALQAAADIVKIFADSLEGATDGDIMSATNNALKKLTEENPALAPYIKYDAAAWETTIAKIRPLVESHIALEAQDPSLSVGIYNSAVDQVANLLQKIELEASKAHEFDGIREMYEVMGKLASAGALTNISDEELKVTQLTIIRGEKALRKVLSDEINRRMMEYADEQGFLAESPWHGSTNKTITADGMTAVQDYAMEAFGIKWVKRRRGYVPGVLNENDPFGVELGLPEGLS